MIRSATIMAVRGASILARFALSLYMARYLGLADVGRFGLAMGIVGFAPSLAGFGLNYFVSRDIIDKPLVEAGSRIRDRLCVTGVSTAVLCGAALFWRHGNGNVNSLPPIFVVITVLEIFALDIHMSLIGLRMAVLAGVLVFIRTASWAFIYMAVSFWDKNLRNLGFAFFLWLAALAVNFVVLAACLRGWPWRESFRRNFDGAWLFKNVSGGWLIYLSDIALAGSLYVDRFVVNHVEGLEMTGIYMFFWSVANSSQALITSSISQVALPRLVAAYREAGVAQWRRGLAAEVLKVFLSGVAVAILAFFAIEIMLPLVHRAALTGFLFLFATMLCASVVRMTSDILNYGLYSRGRDFAYAGTNIVGFVISPVCTFLALENFGLGAVGYAMIGSAAMLLVIRLGMILKLDRHGLQENFNASHV